MEGDLAEDLQRPTSINWLKILDAGQKRFGHCHECDRENWREGVIKSRDSST